MLKFLGFSLYRHQEGIGIRVHDEKSLKRLKDRLKALTSRNRGGTMERILQELTTLIIGWLGYYSIADMKKYVTRLAEWLRRRIRQIYWKRVRTRWENLIQLGIPREQAWQWANTRKSYWHTANSWILTRTVTSLYLKSMGFPEILERFEMLHERIGRLLKLRTPIPTH